MTTFDFRVAFRLPGSDRIGSEEEHLPICEDQSGTVLRLRSGEAGMPIKERSAAALIGGPYSTEAEAWSAAGRARRALLMWAIRKRTGVDLGSDAPRSMFTNAGLRMLEADLGHPVRNAVHGTDVFEHQDGLRFVTLDGDLSVGRSESAFIADVSAEFMKRGPVADREFLAAELVCASHFDTGRRSRFITQVTATEALLEPQGRDEAAQAVVDRLEQVVLSSSLDPPTRDSMRGSLQWFRQESIGQAGRQLVARLLPHATYMDMPADRFFRVCYDVRSSLLHRGVMPSDLPSAEMLFPQAHQFVFDLVLAALERRE